MEKQYSYEIICIHIKLPQKFLLTFLDVKSSMMVSFFSRIRKCIKERIEVLYSAPALGRAQTAGYIEISVSSELSPMLNSLNSLLQLGSTGQPPP